MSVCTIPPEGWSCSREAGHEDPCAATIEHTLFKGWISQGLATAYHAVERVYEEYEQVPENPISEALNRAMSEIEAADEELERYS